jgi:long-subunit acyl-CoA synthetase (AMP-forming)
LPVDGRTPALLDTLLWPLLNTLVAKPLLAQFGGRLRVAMSGGAALSHPVAQCFLGLGLPILQGYGMTRTSPVGRQWPGRQRPGHHRPAAGWRAALERIRTLTHTFAYYAQPRAVALTLEPWTGENTLMTPTLKLKRNNLATHFAVDIEGLYRR